MRSASPIQERRHNKHPNDARRDTALASSIKGTIGSKQQDESLLGSEEGHKDSYGESRAVAHASKGSISTGIVARGAGYDEFENTSGTSRQKPGHVNRPSLGKDAGSDGKAGDCANHTSDQSVRVILQLCYCYANHISIDKASFKSSARDPPSSRRKDTQYQC